MCGCISLRLLGMTDSSAAVLGGFLASSLELVDCAQLVMVLKSSQSVLPVHLLCTPELRKHFGTRQSIRPSQHDCKGFEGGENERS